MKKISVTMFFFLIFSFIAFGQETENLTDTNIIRMVAEFNKYKPVFEKEVKKALIKFIKKEYSHKTINGLNVKQFIKDLKDNKFQICYKPFFKFKDPKSEYDLNKDIAEILFLDTSSASLTDVYILKDNKYWFVSQYTDYKDFIDYSSKPVEIDKNNILIKSIMVFRIPGFNFRNMFVGDNKIMTFPLEEKYENKPVELNEYIKENMSLERMKERIIKYSR